MPAISPSSVKRIGPRIAIPLACVVLALGTLGCPMFVRPLPDTLTAVPLPGPASLRFEDPQTGQRLRQLDACVGDLLLDPSWHTTGYRVLGNYLQSTWCSGPGEGPGCVSVTPPPDPRPEHLVTLNTLLYDLDQPAFGLGLQAVWHPKSAGWSASFWFSESGRTISGDGWVLNLFQLEGPYGPAAENVDLGFDYTYDISGAPRMYFDGTASPTPQSTYSADQITFHVPPDLPLRDDLALYLASPGGMRDRGLAKIHLLAQIVEAALNSHQVMTCDTGPYPGGGVPPACTPRPYTAGEEAAELARAQAHFSQEERLLESDYRDMYAAWMTAFPFDKCWP